MSKISKIILSLPTALGAFVLISRFIHGLENWLAEILNYESQGIVLIGLIFFQEIILIFRIWSFKNVTTSKKAENTFYLIGFNLVAGAVYVWRTDDNFIKMNKKNDSNNIKCSKN